MPLEVGAWKRIVMNILANALKYTPHGQIDVRLETMTQNGQEYIYFAVKDTGIGMSEEYLKYKLFTPFTQENVFSPGTGLGLCIVQQIVRDLGGTLDVKSKLGVGSTISAMIPSSQSIDPIPPPDVNLQLNDSFKGFTLCYVEPKSSTDSMELVNGNTWTPHDVAEKLKSSVTDIASNWLRMRVVYANHINDVDADVYIFDNFLDYVIDLDAVSSKSAICIASPQSSHSKRKAEIKIMRVPVGPRKLAAAILDVLDIGARKVSNPKIEALLPVRHPKATPTISGTTNSEETMIRKSPSIPSTIPIPEHDITIQQPITSAFHTLVVDDNAINLKILTKLLKHLGCTYATAVNGLEAVQTFKAAASSEMPFTLIFMDINMPIMNGFAACQEIRAFQREVGAAPVRVVALTGLGNAASREEAFTSGIDLFLTKPVSLQKLKLLLVPEGEKT